MQALILELTVYISFSFPVTKNEINFHSAAKDNDLESIKKLLREKVDINCKNNVSVH